MITFEVFVESRKKKPCERQPFHENRKGYLNLKTMNEKTFKLEFNNKKENLRK